MSNRKQLLEAIAAIESQRSVLGDENVETALSQLRQQLAEVEKLEAVSSLKLSGERKHVTVMFADISGFSGLTDSLDPESVRELVNACFDHLVPIVHKYGGTVEKFIGDEIMAIFGAPVAHENDPERALRAALEILDELPAFNDAHNVDMGMHIGISTGLVIAGGIGIKGRQEYGVMGDAVSLAAKLASYSQRDEIIIGPETKQLTMSLFEFEPLGPTRFTGSITPIHIYKLKEIKQRRSQFGLRTLEESATRMIGRESELAAIQNSINNAFTNRHTTLMTVVGEAGIGKSRLMQEFRLWLASAFDDVKAFQGRCTQERQGVANHLLRELFASHLGISESDPIDDVRATLEKGIAEILPEAGEIKAQFLGAWFGYDYKQSPHVADLQGDAEQLHSRSMLYLEQFFTAITAKHPVVIFVDDIHWADGGSLNAIIDICQRCPELPLFILCLARPELLTRRQNWGKDLRISCAKMISLDPLPEKDVLALVDEILKKTTNVPPILLEFLVTRAGGNPYYLEELIQMLIDQGVIEMKQGDWQVALEKLAMMPVPATLTAVLQARIDRLTPPQKQALQQAAVVGRVFWDAVLDELGTFSADQLPELAQRDLVVPQERSAFIGTNEYIFKHVLLRDVTYKTLLKKNRSSYHGVVASWLMNITKENGRLDEYAAIIGEHLEKAGETKSAVEWYGHAGIQSAGQFDQEAAEALLTRALELTPSADKAARFKLLLAREAVYHLEGKRDQQAADLTLLKELVGEQGEDTEIQERWAAQVLIRQAEYAGAVSDYPAAIQAASESLAKSESIGDGELAAESLARWGDVLCRQGEYGEAHERHTAGKIHAESAGAQKYLAENLKGLGNVAYLQGSYQEAQTFLMEALDLERKIKDRRGERRCLSNLGIVARAQGDFARAREYYEKSLEIGREIGSRRGESVCLNNLGNVAYLQGDYYNASSSYEKALEIRLKIGDKRGESVCLNNLGNAAFSQGDWPFARQFYQASLQIREEIGDKRGLGLIFHNLGALAYEEGDLEKAEAYFHQALILREELGLPQYTVEDQAGIARVALAAGDLEKALQRLTPVLDYLTENPTLNGAEHPYRVFLICGQILLAAGETSLAKNLLGTAYNRLVELAEMLPSVDQRTLFWQARDYAGINRIWRELGVDD